MAHDALPKVLAIIPARGGSKGVPGKNRRLLDGLPLVAYAILTAQKSNRIASILLNTDDEAIADIGKQYGVPVKMRSAQLAQDDSPIHPTIVESIQFAEEQNSISYDQVMLIQPTSPLRRAADADAIATLLHDNESIDGVVSMTRVEDAHPGRMYTFDDKTRLLQPIWPDSEYGNRQQLTPVYLRNGCFYLARKEALLREGTIIVKRKAAYLMDAEWELNIDTERDFILAEHLVPKWKQVFQWPC
jgi:CMP-N-acetylneuraminic acid synthetase